MAALLSLAVLWQSYRLAERHFLATAALRAETALNLAVQALEADLARYEMVPQLLAELESVRDLAAHPDDPARQAAMNLLLEERNEELMSSDIYIMRVDGLTIAASNHRSPLSFIGERFNYRPYFIEAMQNRPVRFFGVGTTSGVRGYFFSAPIHDEAERITGVVAVKIGLDRIEAAWRGNEYRMFVTDPEGVIFLASQRNWLYGSILPRTAERRARTEASRRYADVAVWEMSVNEEQVGRTPLISLFRPGSVTVDPQFIHAEKEMPKAGWRVHVLLDASGARGAARAGTAVVFLILCALASGAAILLQRRARIAERLALEAQAKAELEERVAARTADLARVNAHLQQEIEERRATEAKLRSTQDNLVQVGKLAALGQMSATLSHEINQPLAAARNFADSAGILIERGDLDRARENIGHILALIERMAAIGRHLRHAARKPKERPEPIALAPLLAETQLILAVRLAAAEAELELDIPPDLPPIRGGATRLQQVLVNLIGNAVDAVEGLADRRITLSAKVEEGRAVITLRDRGPGVPPALVERIFDPFFTTKGVGAGMGLGLSISRNIIRDFGGEISLRNADPGAEFRITFDLYPAAEGVA